MFCAENHTIEVNECIKDIMDTDIFPVIDIGALQDIFLLDTIDEEYRKKNFDYYEFNGMGVPRVSNILKECINNEYLVNWAARIGQKEMLAQRSKALTIGSRVHEKIEHYLLTGKDLELPFTTGTIVARNVENAYKSFKAWKSNLESMGYFIEGVIATEKPIVTNLYGGTIDCVAKINGANYVLDWKTSKQISFEYIIQTCSYMWAVNAGYCPDLPHIDGIGIVRIDKESIKYNDLFLNEHIPYQNDILHRYFEGFGAMLSCYYHTADMRNLFGKYKKIYDFNGTMRG